MKKTQNISIASLPVVIDSDAYELLSKYLNDIATKFKDEDLVELQKDVEVRILEILSEQGWKKDASISKQQIKKCIDQIGSIEDFESSTETGHNPKIEKTNKKLFRDTKNGQILGVCQGIGEYFSIDPVWVRLIFLILAIFNGIGITLYLIAAVAMPDARTEFDRSRLRGGSSDLKTIAHNLGSEVSEAVEKNKVAEKLNSFFSITTSLAFKVLRVSFKIFGHLLRFFSLAVAIILPLTMLIWIWVESYHKDLNLLPDVLNLGEKVGLSILALTMSSFFVILFVLISALFSKKPNRNKNLKVASLAMLVWVAVFASTIPYHSIWSDKFNNRINKIVESADLHDQKVSFEANQDSIDIVPNLPISYSLDFSEDDKLHVVYNLSNSRTSDVFNYKDGELKGNVLKSGEQYKVLNCRTCSNFGGNATIYIPKKISKINILDIKPEDAINETTNNNSTLASAQIHLNDYKNMNHLINNRSGLYKIVGTYPEAICEQDGICHLNPEFSGNAN